MTSCSSTDRLFAVSSPYCRMDLDVGGFTDRPDWPKWGRRSSSPRASSSRPARRSGAASADKTTSGTDLEKRSTSRRITVNTNSAQLQNGYIDFQLNPGSFTTRAANAGVSNVMPMACLIRRIRTTVLIGEISGMRTGHGHADQVSRITGQPSTLVLVWWLRLERRGPSNRECELEHHLAYGSFESLISASV